MNAIYWSIKAAKQLRKLPIAVQKQIRDAVQEKLSVFPHCSSVKALQNHEYEFRLRVGQYRIFFDFDGAFKISLVQEVKKRDEHTY
jgi:mRNA interferase RelE/StbE